jgi:hypothetical protein
MIFDTFNDCSDYQCSPQIQLQQTTNHFCMNNKDLFSSIAASKYLTLISIYVFLLILFAICQAKQFGDQFRKKDSGLEKISQKDKSSISLEESTSRDILFISLQGKNTHSNPWFLDLDTSSDFKTFVKKRDHFTLTRVSRAIISGNQSNHILEFLCSAEVLCHQILLHPSA